ncbi:putative transcription factor C2H2 family [Medicago truncatula]|uniref:Putative transcription factor C2H2 family n=1 Tax=Medicago truncatula TaxID=3880 RepID=G7K6S9_MEDTR|nr:RING-H2 finger protein ATL79 [Medicago truncatula]AES95549.1 zinc finger, C3HC4 type (RING finger) protein [Medicago truncatula]RHN54651.1 putative transcription factor C2H2 family [Medicago truncatula]
MADDDGDHPFYKNSIVLLIVVGSAAFVVASMYRVLVIWFCHPQSTTTDQNLPQPPRFATTPSTSSSIVNLIPTHKYHKRNKGDVVTDDEGGTCAVCLGDFEEGEELRTMPECLHSFHVKCIDMWLHSHLNCPVCRSSAAPSPAVNAHHHSIDMSRLVRW